MTRFQILKPSLYLALVLLPALPPPSLRAQAKPAAPTAGAPNPAVLNLTVDEVIESFIAARGGAEKLRAVESERVTGRISFGPDNSNRLLVQLKRPGKAYMEVAINDKTVTRATNGKTGWQINPFNGESSPQPMNAEGLRNIAKEADFDGPLLDYQAKGTQVALEGREVVAGKKTFKLMAKWKDGDTDYFWLDSTTYLPVKWEGSRQRDGGVVVYESLFSDYRDVDGLQMPFLIKSGTKGREQEQQEIRFEKVELNPKIDDARFALPSAK